MPGDLPFTEDNIAGVRTRLSILLYFIVSVLCMHFSGVGRLRLQAKSYSFSSDHSGHHSGWAERQFWFWLMSNNLLDHILLLASVHCIQSLVWFGGRWFLLHHQYWGFSWIACCCSVSLSETFYRKPASQKNSPSLMNWKFFFQEFQKKVPCSQRELC